MTEPLGNNQVPCRPDISDITAPGNGQPVINREKALARMAGDADLLAQLALFFLDDAPQLLGELESGLAAGDAKAVHHAAHSLKGLSSSFEAIHAMTVARNIEIQSREGNLTECRSLQESLQGEIARVVTALQEMLQQEG